MHRSRRTVTPPEPKTLEQYGMYLIEEEWQHLTQYNHGKLEVQCVPSKDGTSVVFFDRLFIKKLLKNEEKGAVEFSIDKTFDVKPQRIPTRQFVILQIYKGNHVRFVKFSFIIF